MEKRFWVVCYDIRHERRLRRVARVMERFGARVQKSVFECWLSDKDRDQLLEQVGQEMDRTAGDSLRLYALCANCRKVSGQPDAPSIPPLERYFIA